MAKKFAGGSRKKRPGAAAIFGSPLSEKSKRELRRIARLPDSRIDLSDAPEANRLDADVLAWFRAQGPRYQTYINQVLRREAEAHRE